ncbi:MAG TPA: hypothetical protein VK524_14175 [Polyangiaceae bacterium]|nr:hypothetical protein [Polyangiaceae bacterium]
MTLPNGAARSACEREEWYELSPARVRAQGYTTTGLYSTHYWQDQDGLGVFKIDEDDPEDLEDLWPKMRRPRLQRQHQARIEPVDDAHRRSLHWAIGGLVALGAGLGTAVAIEEESPAGAAVAGISGLVGGLVGVVGILASQPSGEDQLYADARRKLFIPGEDELVSAAHGVNNANGSRRRKCGGKPVVFSHRAEAQRRRRVPSSARAALPAAVPANTPVAPPADPASAPPADEPAAAPVAPAPVPSP